MIIHLDETPPPGVVFTVGPRLAGPTYQAYHRRLVTCAALDCAGNSEVNVREEQ